MNTITVALLEDDKLQLKERKRLLEETGKFQVSSWASSSEEFFLKVEENKPDALVLDIDLKNDTTNGIEIAFRMKLPVLFVSGHNATNIKEIERLKIDCDLVVDHISKPYSDEAFKKLAIRFANEVRRVSDAYVVWLDFKTSKRNRIPLDTIVCLYADKNEGSESNNKRIYFSNRTPETLINFTLERIEEKGLSKHRFIKSHKSFRVNVDKIKRYTSDDELEVDVMNEKGRVELKLIPVSDNYQKDVKQQIKKLVSLP